MRLEPGNRIVPRVQPHRLLLRWLRRRSIDGPIDSRRSLPERYDGARESQRGRQDNGERGIPRAALPRVALGKAEQGRAEERTANSLIISNDCQKAIATLKQLTTGPALRPAPNWAHGTPRAERSRNRSRAAMMKPQSTAKAAARLAPPARRHRSHHHFPTGRSSNRSTISCVTFHVAVRTLHRPYFAT